MKITADGFILRGWKNEDAEQLSIIANNKKIYDNLRDAFPFPYTLKDAKDYIEFAQKANSSSVLFAIEKDGKVIGILGAFLKEDVYRKNVEIGYYLAEEYWGRGIMPKAITVLVNYLFDNYDINRVYAEPFARNKESRKALEKAGFRLEVILKCNVIKNGIIEDSCIYSVLKQTP